MDRQRGEGRVDPAIIRAARETDPTPYLEACGYAVKREGRHLSVRMGDDGGEVFRITRREDGRWLWCDRGGAAGGDTIALVQAIEPGIGFREAVYRLISGPVQQPPLPAASPVRNLPRIPRSGPMAREQGREYLRERGISAESIAHGEACGFLRYADGGVFFVGFDRGGTARSATRRAIDPADPVQKRDLLHSDKRYPPVLPGDPATVWIVEGGMDALALHDLARKAGKTPPTAIVSGGATVLGFLDLTEIQEILKRAERITVAGENEKHPAAQERADAGHRKQAERVSEITGREVRIWSQRRCKDLSELNFFRGASSENERLTVG